jgi:ubiquinone/menaquinone biosynthesis C-methylase UbiE
MSYDKSVVDHYLHGNLLGAIKVALPAMGKTIETVTIEELAAVDEFHVGGRLATEHLLKQLNFTQSSDLLDVGCGLGGAARYVASKHQHNVAGIDLTAEYIETGNALCQWLKLGSEVCLVQGSALSMPYQDNSFDGGYMLHVGMNIDDKVSLFSEICRVLKPGAVLGIYDIMRQKDGELTYPVPWAADSITSKLSTPYHYIQALQQAGFEVLQENNRRHFALDFFKQLRVKAEAKEGLPPLGLHILMQENTAIKLQNMVKNIKADLIAPVEIIAKKL